MVYDQKLGRGSKFSASVRGSAGGIIDGLPSVTNAKVLSTIKRAHKVYSILYPYRFSLGPRVVLQPLLNVITLNLTSAQGGLHIECERSIRIQASCGDGNFITAPSSHDPDRISSNVVVLRSLTAFHGWASYSQMPPRPTPMFRVLWQAGTGKLIRMVLAS